MTEKVSLIGAIWRIVTFYRVRKFLGLVRAGNRIFTSSPEGVDDAYAIQGMEMQERLNKIKGTLGSFKRSQAIREQQARPLREKKQNAEDRRAGILVAANKAKAAGDANAVASWQEKFLAVQAEIDECGQRLNALAEQEKADLPMIDQLEAQGRSLIRELSELESKCASAKARLLLAQQKQEAMKEMEFFKSPIERGPVDAVEEEIKRQEAEAEAATSLMGLDPTKEDEGLAREGRNLRNSQLFEQMLGSMNAEAQVKTGTAKQEERPQV